MRSGDVRCEASPDAYAYVLESAGVLKAVLQDRYKSLQVPEKAEQKEPLSEQIAEKMREGQPSPVGPLLLRSQSRLWKLRPKPEKKVPA